MKRFWFITLFLLLTLGASRRAHIVITPPAAAVVGGGDFSDDFDRVDNESLGVNWTQAAGDFDILTNSIIFGSGGVSAIAIYSAQSTGSADQYMKFSLRMATANSVYVIFRYTDASSPFYILLFNESIDDVEWYKENSIADLSDTLIVAADAGPEYGAESTWSVTLAGTDNGTVFRGWLNTSNNVPDSAISWDTITTPDFTLTTDPGANAVNSGNYLGLGGYNADSFAFGYDNFFGGPIP